MGNRAINNTYNANDQQCATDMQKNTEKIKCRYDDIGTFLVLM